MQLLENNIDPMKQSNPQNVADSDVLRVFMAYFSKRIARVGHLR